MAYFNDDPKNTITFEVEGKHFHVNKQTLIQSCEYFEKLIEGDFKEATEDVIVLYENVDVFEVIVKHILREEINFEDFQNNIEFVGEVLDLAEKYGLHKLRNEADDALCKYLNYNNAPKIVGYAKVHGLHYIEQICWNVIKNQIQTNNLNMPIEVLLEFAKHHSDDFSQLKLLKYCLSYLSSTETSTTTNDQEKLLNVIKYEHIDEKYLLPLINTYKESVPAIAEKSTKPIANAVTIQSAKRTENIVETKLENNIYINENNITNLKEGQLLVQPNNCGLIIGIFYLRKVSFVKIVEAVTKTSNTYRRSKGIQVHINAKEKDDHCLIYINYKKCETKIATVGDINAIRGDVMDNLYVSTKLEKFKDMKKDDIMDNTTMKRASQHNKKHFSTKNMFIRLLCNIVCNKIRDKIIDNTHGTIKIDVFDEFLKKAPQPINENFMRDILTKENLLKIRGDGLYKFDIKKFAECHAELLSKESCSLINIDLLECSDPNCLVSISVSLEKDNINMRFETNLPNVNITKIKIANEHNHNVSHQVEVCKDDDGKKFNMNIDEKFLNTISKNTVFIEMVDAGKKLIQKNSFNIVGLIPEIELSKRDAIHYEANKEFLSIKRTHLPQYNKKYIDFEKFFEKENWEVLKEEMDVNIEVSQEEVETYKLLKQISRPGYTLTKNNYVDVMKVLTKLEDQYCCSKIERIDIGDIVVERETKNLIISIDDASQIPTMLSEGDRVVLTCKDHVPGERNKTVCLIEKIEGGLISISSYNGFIRPRCYTAKFERERFPNRLAIHALKNMNTDVLDTILFPKSISNANSNRMNDLTTIYNPNITQSKFQLDAVKGIVNGTSNPAPYILIGPPGTGKTTVIVEAITQICLLDNQQRVLVVAPSNFACDEITKRLMRYLPSNILFRYFSRSCEKLLYEIDDDLLIISNFYSGVYVEATKPLLKQFRVVICTAINAGRLQLVLNEETTDDLPFFKYIFFDECGSCPEETALVPLTSLITTNNIPNIVLSGDPKQLGPIYHCGFVTNTNLRTSIGLTHSSTLLWFSIV